MYIVGMSPESNSSELMSVSGTKFAVWTRVDIVIHPAAYPNRGGPRAWNRH